MSDDDNGNEYEGWENDLENVLDASELGDKPDIWEVWDRDSVDDPEAWERAWDFVPNDLSDDQYDAIMATIEDYDGEWDDLYDLMYEDFWEWFRENYEGS